MALYIHKPLKMCAFQFDYKRSIYNYAPDWFLEAVCKSEQEEGRIYHHMNGFYVIETLQGLMEISDGDFVVKGITGEIYPCKPDIFKLSYDFYGYDEKEG